MIVFSDKGRTTLNLSGGTLAPTDLSLGVQDPSTFPSLASGQTFDVAVGSTNLEFMTVTAGGYGASTWTVTRGIDSRYPAVSHSDHEPVVEVVTAEEFTKLYLKWYGNWVSTTTYDYNSLVVYEGAAWLAVAPSTNQAPVGGSTYWQPLGAVSSVANTYSGLPAASGYVPGTFAFATDQGKLYRSNGTSWIAVGAPTSITDADVAAGAAVAESKLALASDAAANVASRRTLGTGSLQAAAGNDARLSDARTPTAHAASHAPGGSDALDYTQVHKIGTHAARPAAATANSGLLYLETDTNGGTVFRSNGTSWDQMAPGVSGGSSTLAGDSDVAVSSPADNQELQYHSADSKWHNAGPIKGLLTSPPTGVWSWVNQSTATIDETAGLYLYCPQDSSDTWRGRWKSAPSTPYTIDVLIEPYLNLINYNGAAIGWRDSSSGNMVLVSQYANMTVAGYKQLNVGKANTTSITANYLSDWIPAEWYRWLRIADDGTNRIVSISRDGLHWLQLHSVGRTDYLTADQVGFAAESRNGSWPAALAVLSWREH